MLALYIILSILAFFFLLLVCPLRLYFKYVDNEVHLDVGYLFLKFRLVPEKEKKEPETKPEKAKEDEQTEPEKKKEDNFLFKLYQKYKVKGTLEIAKRIFAILKSLVMGILKHIKLKVLNIYVGYAGEDAADTAHKVGIISSFSYPLFTALVASQPGLKQYYLNIEPLFLSTQTKIYIETKVTIKPLFLISSVLRAAFALLKLLLKFRKDLKEDRPSRKTQRKPKNSCSAA